MSAPYYFGLAVAGTTAVAVGYHDGRRKVFGPWDTGARIVHDAALVGLERIQALTLADPSAPRVVFVRQTSVVSAWANRGALVTAPVEARWSSAKSPDGEHPLLTAAAQLAAPEARP